MEGIVLADRLLTDASLDLAKLAQEQALEDMRREPARVAHAQEALDELLVDGVRVRAGFNELDHGVVERVVRLDDLQDVDGEAHGRVLSFSATPRR